MYARKVTSLISGLVILSLAGCGGAGNDIFDPEKNDLYDRPVGLSRDDYRHMTRPETDVLEPHIDGPPRASVDLGEPPIPDISEILATPRPPEIGESQLVTVFVTEEAPLKDVLIELARQANVDVEIDASIQGGIVFRARNRPFNEVVERIAELSGLRYKMENGVLRFERDTPFVHTYPLHFLSFDREATSDMNVTTSVLSTGGGGSGALNSGSNAAITYTAEADFWTGMEEAVEAILGFRRQNGAASGLGLDAGGLPPVSSTGGAESGLGGETFFVVNRQAGTLTVSGNSYHHELVTDYLRKMQEVSSAQVLIEAKIIEVTLDEEFQSGVNWNQIFDSEFAVMAGDYTDGLSGTGFTQFLLDIGGDAEAAAAQGSLDLLVSFVERFGTTRTLSSPRVHAMNNQQAVVTFAQNVIYFDISVEREVDETVTGNDNERFTFDSERITIPVGIILALQPSINLDTQEITLAIRPTVSRVTELVPDPVVALILSQLPSAPANVTSNIPQIEVRELDSMVRMRDGQVMVLGGLMEQTGTSSEVGLPGVSSIPWIGNAFKQNLKQEQMTELFFLIKATIVGNNTNLHPADKTIYNKFGTDHRPLAF